jgi:hypothetical protein
MVYIPNDNGRTGICSHCSTGALHHPGWDIENQIISHLKDGWDIKLKADAVYGFPMIM